MHSTIRVASIQIEDRYGGQSIALNALATVLTDGLTAICSVNVSDATPEVHSLVNETILGLRALRSRVDHHHRYARKHIEAIIRATTERTAQVVIFPECAVPPEFLADVDAVARNNEHPHVIVAGTQYVDHSTRMAYSRLGIDCGKIREGQAYAPVLVHQDGIRRWLAVPKIAPATREERRWPADDSGWTSITFRGIELAVLICSDFLGGKECLLPVMAKSSKANLILVPAQNWNAEEFQIQVRRNFRNCKGQKTAYANVARFGGSFVYGNLVEGKHAFDGARRYCIAGPGPFVAVAEGSEAVVIADVQLPHDPLKFDKSIGIVPLVSTDAFPGYCKFYRRYRAARSRRTKLAILRRYLDGAAFRHDRATASANQFGCFNAKLARLDAERGVLEALTEDKLDFLTDIVPISPPSASVIDDLEQIKQWLLLFSLVEIDSLANESVRDEIAKVRSALISTYQSLMAASGLGEREAQGGRRGGGSTSRSRSGASEPLEMATGPVDSWWRWQGIGNLLLVYRMAATAKRFREDARRGDEQLSASAPPGGSRRGGADATARAVVRKRAIAAFEKDDSVVRQDRFIGAGAANTKSDARVISDGMANVENQLARLWQMVPHAIMNAFSITNADEKDGSRKFERMANGIAPLRQHAEAILAIVGMALTRVSSGEECDDASVRLAIAAVSPGLFRAESSWREWLPRVDGGTIGTPSAQAIEVHSIALEKAMAALKSQLESYVRRDDRVSARDILLSAATVHSLLAILEDLVRTLEK